ncbi:glycoside hydrolase family 3 protein [Pseudoxanthomonas koreensis]|uniref:glycoside hydrolase family 3 protein n=1 Tax=Pseudoxanthomonas koreensis TaxID=266061 RepID=UPI001391C805|nr:glycoside hydrolase family 3 protein [Pseudoxanthomonas koreensis]KAF1693596.1 1,4-beta-D-glucan glucohydrolase [Pseudoxanthomonas koreensis]
MSTHAGTAVPATRFRNALAAALVLAVLAACNRSAEPAATAAAPAAADGSIHPGQWPQLAWPLAADPALEKQVDDLLATMTLEEKVGQLIQGDIGSITPEDVRKYRLGSILAGGSSDPGGRYNATPAEWLALSDAFWEASMDTSGGGKAIPGIWGIDAMHGQSNVVGATLFPHNVGLGATRNPELLRKIGEITAMETRTTGIEWAFAPTVAVPQDVRWGRAYEGYSENPQVVAGFAKAMVEGLQGKPGEPGFLGDSRVMVSVKHFVGDGGTTGGRDQGDTQVSEAELRDVHAAGYRTAIEAGAQSVMASFNSFHGTKMHGHQPLLTDVLKGRMNFGGFVVGDWNGHGQIPGCTNDDCPATFTAGLDMAMAPDSWKGMYDSTLAAAKDGTLSMARLDDAVKRILRVKFRMGLFDAPRPSQRALGGKFELLGAPEHRAVARQAVRESLVLLKNQGGVLPLRTGQKVLVAGDGADNMSKQTGGWTLNWQGTGTVRADFPNADTIWEGLQRAVKAGGGQAELAVDGRYKSKPDVAVVVFGENPYAEFQGDIPNLLFHPGDDSDLELIRKLKADGIPVVAVFISGRPLWMNREINAADAFVAAWLPGSEGAGVADVLLRKADGSVDHDFKGKLSFSWPRNAVDAAVNRPGHDPQFAFGYGLTYADNGDVAPLPEDSGIEGLQAPAGVYFAGGQLAPGLSLSLEGAQAPAGAVTTVPVALAGDALAVTAVDHERQEDARRLPWSGAQPAAAAIRSEPPQDLARETNGDLLLVLTLRPDAVPASGSGSASAGAGTPLPLRETLAALPAGQWTTLGIPLKCFAASGADTAKLDLLLKLHSDAAATLSVSRVAVGAVSEAQHILSCPQS